MFLIDVYIYSCYEEKKIREKSKCKSVIAHTLTTRYHRNLRRQRKKKLTKSLSYTHTNIYTKEEKKL